MEEYTTAFQALQYDITMHNCHYDDIFFAETYVSGLKDEIRAVVEPHVPVTVNRAVVIAKIQQRTLERSKAKYQRNYAPQKAAPYKQENNQQSNTANWQRIRQLRDYRKANNLCYNCGEKFEPGHQAVCTKRQQPQLNALAVNDLDKEEITDEMLNHLAAEDVLAEDFCQLSLNAMTIVDTSNSIKLRTLAKKSYVDFSGFWQLPQLC